MGYKWKKPIKNSLLLPFLCTPLLLSAQKAEISGVAAYYDSTSIVELYDQTPVGLEITYKNGDTRQTEGFMQGDYRWKYIKVTTPDGVFRNGYLSFDRHKVAQQHYQVKLEVTLPEAAGQAFETTLQLPYITGIRFNHYADSLKRGIHFYLNVEARFSTGKIYPLDTAAVRFETSAGKLLGQDLLLPEGDTTRFITVKAVSRTNPKLAISSVIPVKQKPDDDSMIINDERDVLDKRKKRKG
ncbi:hypothetical protein F0L74_17250 [Chitinophaga agrisoli]|uniref:Uncharacterized protein n=1 Tax=Chitinophaga agrisoli TaxID=2607653 RepID=A0A5B2VTI3_9BACT|nr:hypothetical protein [Chitinophaga agrisoli]KAA2241632.1 hypothetical protein F0L74_17250 [Chitinophaga agrisoli]